MEESLLTRLSKQSISMVPQIPPEEWNQIVGQSNIEISNKQPPKIVRLRQVKPLAQRLQPRVAIDLIPKEVRATAKVGPARQLDMIPTDTYEKINCTWFNIPTQEVYRIGTIGDGSCFVHSLLQGYYPPYQTDTLSYNDQPLTRTQFVDNLRRDLANQLGLEDPNDTDGRIYWETAANGTFQDFYDQQEAGDGSLMKDVFGFAIDFSLEGLQKLLNSRQYLGAEVYQYISDSVEVDIYIMTVDQYDLHPYINTSLAGRSRRSVVICGNGYHYETVAIQSQRNGLFQTLFDPTDPFIRAIRQQIEDVEGNRE